MFVAYDVCRIMTFVANYDVCRQLWGLSLVGFAAVSFKAITYSFCRVMDAFKRTINYSFCMVMDAFKGTINYSFCRVMDAFKGTINYSFCRVMDVFIWNINYSLVAQNMAEKNWTANRWNKHNVTNSFQPFIILYYIITTDIWRL